MIVASPPVLYGIGRFTGVLYRSLTIIALYVVLAPALLVLLGEVGLALGFSIAQTGGAVLATVLVAASLGLLRGPDLVAGLWPCGASHRHARRRARTLRLLLMTVEVPVAWRGLLYIGRIRAPPHRRWRGRAAVLVSPGGGGVSGSSDGGSSAP